MPATDPSDLVGARISVQLTTGAQLEGTVFTYCTTSGVLALVHDTSVERPTVRLINACHVAACEVLNKDPTTLAHCLPDSVARGAALPPIPTDQGQSVQKRMAANIRRGEQARKYVDGQPLTIEACDVYDCLSRSLPAEWSTEREHLDLAKDAARNEAGEDAVADVSYVIVVGNVVVSGNGGAGGFSWRCPVLTELDDSDHGTLARVKQAIEKNFPK